MARRKKEPLGVHRDKILSAASALFAKKGITATTVDEIAKESGYSKATLYVYFKNKEEIVGLLTLKSMETLYDCLSSALLLNDTTKSRYDAICHGLVKYQEEFPFYFKTVLDKIDVDFKSRTRLPEEQETYRAGEKINEKMKDFVTEGIKNGDLKTIDDAEIMPTIFGFWGTMSGLIQLADSKAEYIKNTMGLSKDQFLKYGFNMLYRSVAKGEI